MNIKELLFAGPVGAVLGGLIVLLLIVLCIPNKKREDKPLEHSVSKDNDRDKNKIKGKNIVIVVGVVVFIVGLSIIYHKIIPMEYDYNDIKCNEKTNLCTDLNGQLITGIVKKFYENGRIEKERHFKNGQRDGISKSFYENGQLEYEQYFKNGQRNGISKSFYENGQLESEISFKNGKLDGISIEYDDNGKIKIEKHYKNEELEISKEYYESGQLMREEHYENGQMIYTNDYLEDGTQYYSFDEMYPWQRGLCEGFGCVIAELSKPGGKKRVADKYDGKFVMIKKYPLTGYIDDYNTIEYRDIERLLSCKMNMSESEKLEKATKGKKGMVVIAGELHIGKNDYDVWENPKPYLKPCYFIDVYKCKGDEVGGALCLE